MLRKPCKMTSAVRRGQSGRDAGAKRDGEIADALGHEETATVVGERFAGAGGNDHRAMSLSGTTSASERNSSSFRSSTGTVQVRALRSMFLRLAKRAGLQREAVARMRSRGERLVRIAG